MHLTIEQDKKIKAIQNEFSNFYPYLRLQFFPSDTCKTRENMEMPYNIDLPLSDITNFKGKELITVSGTQKVADLEKELKELLGLNVQVYRKSGRVWLMTGSTDHWTLDEQNKEGQELEKDLVRENVEDFDQYHEQE